MYFLIEDWIVLCVVTGLIVTGSWDKNIKLWDPRTNQCTGTYQQPEKVFQSVTILKLKSNLINAGYYTLS